MHFLLSTFVARRFCNTIISKTELEKPDIQLHVKDFPGNVSYLESIYILLDKYKINFEKRKAIQSKID